MSNPLDPLADAVIRCEAEQDVRSRMLAADRLAAAVKQVPKRSNETTQQVVRALILKARSRHGGSET